MATTTSTVGTTDKDKQQKLGVQGQKVYTAYEKFQRSIHNEATRTSYSYYLKQFLAFSGFNKYEHLLTNLSTKKKEELIRSYIQYLVQDRKLSYSSVNNTTASIRLFYVSNGVYLAFWESLKSIKGKNRLIIKNRTYTLSEVRELIEHAGLRERVAVLVMLSSGIRVGALAGLRVGDLTYNEQYKLYRIEVYSEDNEESYVTYCTPECAVYIDKYLDSRKKDGEKITQDSPLITYKIYSSSNSKSKEKRSKSHTLRVRTVEMMLTRLRYDAKVVAPITMKEVSRKVREQPGKRPSQFVRKEVMGTHVFRKMFDTACVDNNVNVNIMKAMMGHDIGLQKYYYKPENEDKLISEYLKVIDALTVDEAYHLKRKTEKLEKQVEEINALKLQLLQMENAKREYEEKTQKEIAVLWELNDKREVDAYKEAINEHPSSSKYKERVARAIARTPEAPTTKEEDSKLTRKIINFLPENRRWKKEKGKIKK